MHSDQPQVGYLAHTQIGEKGQLTIPKRYRDDLGLGSGAPVAVLRVGDALILVPEQSRFRLLCESIASVLESRHVTPADLADTLLEARQRVFARRYPELAGQVRKSNARRRAKDGE
jgi:AbrB family looped-hinge helix DNA binding protein